MESRANKLSLKIHQAIILQSEIDKRATPLQNNKAYLVEYRVGKLELIVRSITGQKIMVQIKLKSDKSNTFNCMSAHVQSSGHHTTTYQDSYANEQYTPHFRISRKKDIFSCSGETLCL